ncbi:MAG: alpha/beta hydrolase [Clostridiales bacterium]|nr:alpha/beta hydrolase [Candidatus Equinaster intestinalis]
MKTVIYIHGQGGSSDEARHYKPLFEDCNVLGFDYLAATPWEAKDEFANFFDTVYSAENPVIIIANSIGAFFALTALADKPIEKAYFISPVIDMEKLIENMMLKADVSEEELRKKGVIKTQFGQELSWEYLSFVRQNPVNWKIPTHILYGSNDNLTTFETVCAFAKKTGATLTIMENGEHWFHTEKQMKFLDNWIKSM